MASSSRRGGSTVILLLSLLAPSLFQAHAEIPAGWSTNLQTALQAAQTLEQPVLVYYTASWCGPCQRMAQTTFPEENVQQALQGFYRVVLDIEVIGKPSETPAIHAVPTFVVLTSKGDEVARTTGYQAPQPFVQWLTNQFLAAREAIARQHRFTQALAATEQLLAQATPDSLAKAAAELFDWCAAPEVAIQQAAMQQLTTLVNRHPAVLLDGLNHPRLATRIAIANLLRSRLGQAFDVDPWETADHRRTAVANWKTKL